MPRVKPGNAIRSLGQRRPGGRRHRPAGRPRDARRGRARVRALASARSPCVAGPIVAVLATGDEVRAPGTDLGPAGIPDANGPGLRALVRDAGGESRSTSGSRWTRSRTSRRGSGAALAEADLVVVSGGVSVGPYDVVRLAFDNVGHMDLWRVAVQPGKPFAFGRADVEGRDDPVLLFGLPGNPVSAFVTFELFVRPVLRRLAGHARLHRPVDRAVLERAGDQEPGPARATSA